MIPNEVTIESIEVPKALAAVMQDIPRKFNETLTDWAIRCQILRRYQPMKEETNAEPIR